MSDTLQAWLFQQLKSIDPHLWKYHHNNIYITVFCHNAPTSQLSSSSNFPFTTDVCHLALFAHKHRDYLIERVSTQIKHGKKKGRSIKKLCWNCEKN